MQLLAEFRAIEELFELGLSDIARAQRNYEKSAEQQFLLELTSRARLLIGRIKELIKEYTHTKSVVS